ncbi:MAG: BREX system P-loop protein BrxC, partial [Nannocystaceae bacterium]
SLDGKLLPDGTPLAKAWLARDTTMLRDELHQAWEGLLAKVRPMAVVFDIGGVSRGDEHIHAAVVRQVQARLGYCEREPLVADYELRLEGDGHYERFEATVQQVVGRPWSEVKNTHMVEDDFSLVLHEMFPDKFRDPMDWINARAGQAIGALSAEDAARALQHMLQRRAPDHTLFIVVDEVSQYIFGDDKRMLALQSLVSALEQRLRGRAWLLATGQQQLDDLNDDNVLGKMKDRFPPALRVHLAATNIRDVVHKRLLHKQAEHEPVLRRLYQQHRSNLQLFAYGCEDLTEEDFVEVYPLLPRHIDLILQITSALRTRSRRSQGDDHQIRGLLQMLGELFRSQGVADMEVGRLITLDLVHAVQGSSLDGDVQNTLARILEFCASKGDELAARCAKAVSLLELLQGDEGGLATDSRLVARCLYQGVSDGDNEPAVREALERLRHENLLGYSDQTGYKIQSSAGQDWERVRRDQSISSGDQHDLVRDALERLVTESGRGPKLQGRAFPWYGLFSNELSHQEQPLRASREDGPVTVDFRFLPIDAQDTATWVNRSSESSFVDRIVWVAGNYAQVLDAARELGKSRAMIRRHAPMREALSQSKRRLLLEEETREEVLRKALRDAVGEAFMAGRLYFRGADDEPHTYGSTFTTALEGVGVKRLPELYRHFSPVSVLPSELKQLTTSHLSGPSSKFYPAGLGILEEDAGRPVATCTGPIPTRVYDLVQREQGIAGIDLLRHFSGPPYGYEAGVIKACVAGLLHASKVRLSTDTGEEITSVADAGVQDLFDKDRSFKRTTIAPAGESRIKPQDRAKIRELFARAFRRSVDPDNEAIADAVFSTVPEAIGRLRDVERALARLPGHPEPPPALLALHKAFEDCLRKRQVEPAVLAVRKHLQVLREGVELLNQIHLELTDDAIEAVVRAHGMWSIQLQQLYERGAVTPPLSDAEREIAEQLRGRYPWRDIAGIEPQVEAIGVAYTDERRRLLQLQEQQAEAAREAVKCLPGFAALGDEDRYTVLRPITNALRESTEQQTAPTLAQLHDGLEARLVLARREAEERLHELQDASRGEVLVAVTIAVRHREIRSAQEVDEVVEDLRERLMEYVDKGQAVRLRLE